MNPVASGGGELLTVTRLGLPPELRRSLACTNIIETAAGMIGAAKGFRKLKAHKQLPALRAALAAHNTSLLLNADLAQPAKVA